MNFDLRLPIGIMFSLFGVMVALYGLASDKKIYDSTSLGININLWWGLVLLAFGSFMLFLARKGVKNAASSPTSVLGKMISSMAPSLVRDTSRVFEGAMFRQLIGTPPPIWRKARLEDASNQSSRVR